MKRKNILKTILLFPLFVIIALLFYPVGYFVLPKQINHPDQILKAGRPEVKKGSICAYIINLDRSPERLTYIQSNVEKLDIPMQRISAVDGKKLSEKEISEKVDPRKFKSVTRGEIGCSLSHIKTWKTFLESSYEYALIFEDDVSFDPQQLKLAIDELIADHKLWDINTFDVLTSESCPILTIKTLKNNKKLSVYLGEIGLAGGYMVNRKAAQKLLERALPLIMPVDHYFARSWEFGLTFTGVENPRLVYQTFGNSDIGERGKSDFLDQDYYSQDNTAANRLLTELRREQKDIIRFSYNLMVYLKSFF